MPNDYRQNKNGVDAPRTIKADKREKVRERFRLTASDTTETVISVVNNIFNDGRERTVAVYLRTAITDAEQLHSLDIQKAYYVDFIARQENWRLVDIYRDAGASGTSPNRIQFNRMIDDCVSREKGISLIITKSISRFSRSLVDVIAAIEKLSNLNPPVGIFFEMENLYSLDTGYGSIIELLIPSANSGLLRGGH